MVQIEKFDGPLDLDRNFLHLQAERFDIKLDSNNEVVEELKKTVPLVRCTEDMFKNDLEQDVFKINKLKNAYCIPENDELFVMNTQTQVADGGHMSALRIVAYPCNKDTKEEEESSFCES